MIKIAIYCSAGVELGYGHLIRIVSLLQEVPKRYEIKIFPNINNKDLHLFGELRRNIKLFDDSIQIMMAIKKFKPSIMLWDTVDCEERLFFEIKGNVSLNISISPIFNYMKYVDVLFTRGEKPKLPNSVQIYHGLEYVLFNKNCFKISDSTYENNLKMPFLNIGISMGGGDAENRTLKILKNITEIKQSLTLYIILGEGYIHSYEDLLNTIKVNNNHEIIIAKSNRSMWRILSNCSLVILAGGITSIEAVYAGMPAINLFEEKKLLNNSPNSILFQKKASLAIVEDFKGNFQKLKDLIIKLNYSKNLLLNIRENSKGLLNKNAPKKIFNIINQIFKKIAS